MVDKEQDDGQAATKDLDKPALQTGEEDPAQEQEEGSFDRVLNQDEIDSLLGHSNEGSARKHGWRILVDSSKISYERLPMLEVVFDRLIRLLSTSLRNFTSDNVEVSIVSMTSIRFGDYLESIPVPTIISVYKIEEWGTSGLINVDASFIYSIVDVLLGGHRGATLTKVEGRPFTSIECRLVQRLVELILSDFTRAFEPVVPVTFRYERMEINPRFATIVRPVNAAIITKIRVEMENRGGTFDFMIPYSSIEPARDQLLQMFTGEKSGLESIWETHFTNEIWDANVTLETILECMTLDLNDVLSWKPGTQVLLRAKPDSTVRVVCGDSPVFSGKMGQSNGYVSVRIEENFLKNKVNP